MAAFDPKKRVVIVQTLHILGPDQNPRDFDWQNGGYLSFEAYEGFNAWCGRLPRQDHRKNWPSDGIQSDLSKFDELTKLLRPQADDSQDLYLEAPKLGQYRESSNDLALRLINEAKIYEIISRNPHTNLGSYFGCVVKQGRLVRLALRKYSQSLKDRCKKPEESTGQQRDDCIGQIQAAAAHLHSIGLAHNDISPSNIMFTPTGQAVLIDFDTCAQIGTPLTKGGLVTGWKGPIAGEGRSFTVSSAECDTLAIQEIRAHLCRMPK